MDKKNPTSLGAEELFSSSIDTGGFGKITGSVR
jgi:hypothetical protein